MIPDHQGPTICSREATFKQSGECDLSRSCFHVSLQIYLSVFTKCGSHNCGILGNCGRSEACLVLTTFLVVERCGKK